MFRKLSRKIAPQRLLRDRRSSRRFRPNGRVRRYESLEGRVVLDSTVVFNEVMYNPGVDQELEWIELYNQMAVDMDLCAGASMGSDTRSRRERSGRRSISGGCQVAREVAGSARAGGSVGALHRPIGQQGERLRLVNNSHRTIDQLDFADRAPWPVAPDGSGATLAKRDPGQATVEIGNWTTSATGRDAGSREFCRAATLDGSESSPIRLNEVASATASSFWIELANRQQQPVDVTDYVLQRGDSSTADRSSASGPSRPAGSLPDTRGGPNWLDTGRGRPLVSLRCREDLAGGCRRSAGSADRACRGRSGRLELSSCGHTRGRE